MADLRAEDERVINATQEDYLKIKEREYRKVEGFGPLAIWRRRQRVTALAREYAALRHPGEQFALKRRLIADDITSIGEVDVVYSNSPAETIIVYPNVYDSQTISEMHLSEAELGSKKDPRVHFVVKDKKTKKPVGRAFYAVPRDRSQLGAEVRKMPTPSSWDSIEYDY